MKEQFINISERRPTGRHRILGEACSGSAGSHSIFPLQLRPFFLWGYLALLAGLTLWVPGAMALEAGAAKTDITAPIGTPLNGYGARMGRDSEGIHDPIWSHALYLDDGQTRLFLVSVDLVAINPELRQRVVELAPSVAPPENIILTATHTHNGHGGMTRSIPIRFVSGRFMPDVLEKTAAGIAASMQNAYDKRRRAALGYGVGTHEGLTANRRYSDGPTENQVGVILVEDAEGNPISCVTHFTAHPTSIGDTDMFLFSADYPGYYYLEMETLFGPECIPLFLNGALGNQTIGNPENKEGWDRTESVGRLVAKKAHEIAQTIAFSEPALVLSHKSAALPHTLAKILQPEEVLLQTLEINDLLMSFFPGEPCVELGLKLRDKALARGYAAHLSVGLSNNYIMYFVPRHLYADSTYESSMTFFGPGIEDWFYEHFESLMPHPAVLETVLAEEDEALVEEINGGTVITLSGSPRLIGIARGNALVADIQERYEQRVVQAVEKGLWMPESGIWTYLPSFVDAAALALPMLGMGSRNLLKGLSMELIQEMEGMAEGARLPFDGLWLLQNAPLYSSLEDKTPLYAAPICTMFAITGNLAGSSNILVGRNLDWELPEKAVVTRVKPDQGHAFIQAGFSWNAGVFTAMNDAGLTLCMERLQPETGSLPQKAPVEFVLRDIIQQTDSFNAALEILKSLNYITNVHVLLAGFEAGKPQSAVIELGPIPVVRVEEKGILLGVDPNNAAAPLTTRNRYAATKEYLDSLQSIDAELLQQFMTGNGQAAEADLGRVWNTQTRHSAIVLPQTRELRIAFPGESGSASGFATLTAPGE